MRVRVGRRPRVRPGLRDGGRGGDRPPLRRYERGGVVRGRAQRRHDLVRGGPPVGVLRQALPDQRSQVRRHPRQIGLVVHHLVGHDVRAVRVEGPPAGRRVDEHGPQGEHIGGGPDLARSLELLGRHVRRRADQLARLGAQIAVVRPGDPEVDDLGPGVGEQHIARLEVAVDHPGPMDVAQRLGESRRQPAQFGGGHRPVPLHLVGERGTGHVQGGHPRPYGIRIGVDDRCGEGAADPPGRPDLLPETCPELGVRRVLLVHHLDGQLQPGGGARQVHDSHAARAETCLKTVLPGVLRMLRFRSGSGTSQRRHRPPPCVRPQARRTEPSRWCVRSGRGL